MGGRDHWLDTLPEIVVVWREIAEARKAKEAKDEKVLLP